MAFEPESDNLFSDHLIIIKGRFKALSMNLYGLFIIIFNQDKRIDTYNIAVSTFSNIYENEPHLPWDKYEQMILELKWKGNFNANLTSSIMDNFKEISAEDIKTNQLYDYVNSYDYNSLDTYLFDTINRVVHDKNLVLETSIQEVTAEEFAQTKEKRYNKAEEKSTSETELEEGAVILNIQPILAPVKGKPIYELKIGDRIMTKIIPNTDRANYFIDLLGLRVENHIKPIATEVIDIKSDGKSEPLEILTRIGPGIYGKCIEDERQVKLRLYDALIDGPLTQKVIPKQTQPSPTSVATYEDVGFSKLTYVIISLFVLLLIIFVLLIYISF
ncbi:MAG: hypothetical protein KBG92_01835 [Spirochaetes bacterium]|jgi:hypothetical protein|nr:hypothetical protein [Spirochaetota bacterium]HOE20729.1 hypothetical protein [Spirochaetota bacterium]HQL43354.1 hypothetical protein [Spirochaetota bacterium]